MLSIIGCGNLNRSDDGVGAIVAQRLMERLSRYPVPGVRAFDCGTAGMEVMFAARGSDALLVLDASRSGSEPGAIFEVPGSALERLKEPSYSLHDFRWDNALAVGRKIFREEFPREVQVWLVEVSSIAFGTTLSPAVEKASGLLYERALGYIADYAARRHAEAPTEVPVTLTIRRGSLQLPRAVYERYFEGREGALLLERGTALCVVPVETTMGGNLVKQRNIQGDRAIDVAEFLRTHGWDDSGEYACIMRWDAEFGGICVERL